MAKSLKADDIICTELEVRDGLLTGRPIGHLCFDKEKAIRLLAYCDKHNFSPEDGHPACVNPDTGLRKAAIKKDWKILNWEN